MKVAIVIRKGKSKVHSQALTPAQSKGKSNKPAIEFARNLLANKLKGKGKYRVEVLRGDEKAGEWTIVPKKSKKAA